MQQAALRTQEEQAAREAAAFAPADMERPPIAPSPVKVTVLVVQPDSQVGALTCFEIAVSAQTCSVLSADKSVVACGHHGMCCSVGQILCAVEDSQPQDAPSYGTPTGRIEMQKAKPLAPGAA